MAVEVRRGDPLGSVVAAALSGGPSGRGVVDEAVVAPAGQGELVDIGVATVLPVPFGVVDLAAVGRCDTAGFAASAFQRVQNEALPGAGGTPPAAVVKLNLARIMKKRQVGVGPGGRHSDKGRDG